MSCHPGDWRLTRSEDPRYTGEAYGRSMRRFAGIAVAASALAVLLVVPTAPARAVTSGDLLVSGTAQMGNGIAYPCLGGKMFPVVDLNKCAPLIPTNNTASLTMTGTAAGTIYNGPTKGTKANTVEAGTWSLQATGIYKGACGFGSGNLSGSLTPLVQVGTKAKSRAFYVSFIDSGGVWTIQGSTNKGERIEGTLSVETDPVSGSQCLDKRPKNLPFADGHLTIIRVP